MKRKTNDDDVRRVIGKISIGIHDIILKHIDSFKGMSGEEAARLIAEIIKETSGELN